MNQYPVTSWQWLTIRSFFFIKRNRCNATLFITQMEFLPLTAIILLKYVSLRFIPLGGGFIFFERVFFFFFVSTRIVETIENNTLRNIWNNLSNTARKNYSAFSQNNSAPLKQVTDSFHRIVTVILTMVANDLREAPLDQRTVYRIQLRITTRNEHACTLRGGVFTVYSRASVRSLLVRTCKTDEISRWIAPHCQTIGVTN